ncbi:unnamed protein product, partial [Dibothriocephalus latus]
AGAGGGNIDTVGLSSARGSNRGSSESLHEAQQKRLQSLNDPTMTAMTPLSTGTTGLSQQQHVALGPSRQPPVVTTTTPYTVSLSPGSNSGQPYKGPPSQQAYPPGDLPPDTRRPTDDTGRTKRLMSAAVLFERRSFVWQKYLSSPKIFASLRCT